MNRIIARIKGGLGNQLFCYAAARRLAITNDAELVLDHVTGFTRDRIYRRQYMLDHFQIPARKATPPERLEPFERYRRGLMKYLARKKPFEQRQYLEQEGRDFDERILSLKIKGTIYLDGYWQGDGYFKDMESTIRKDLHIIPPIDSLNQGIAEDILNCQAVAIHVRWFDDPSSITAYNISADYYQRAISLMEEKISYPHYFLFSDDPEATRAKLPLPEGRVTFITNNRGKADAYADLWLMSKCRHFITANSTFSWWGAWLGERKEKLVVTPDLRIIGKASWGFKGLLPPEWIKL